VEDYPMSGNRQESIHVYIVMIHILPNLHAINLIHHLLSKSNPIIP
jgi:hypothetical protein